MNNSIIEAEKKLFEQFTATHKQKNISYKTGSIDYYCSGKGENTVMVLPHISSLFSQEMAYHHILNFEKHNTVLAPELTHSTTIDEVAGMLNYLLEKENRSDVIIYGQSGSGITAQIFFNRYYNKVKGMILVHTIAPGKDVKAGSGILNIIKFLPGFLLKYMFKRKLAKYSKDIVIPDKCMPRIKQTYALMEKYFKTRFSKKNLLKELEFALQFNNEAILSLKDLPDWNGRILIVTSKDDSGYEDSIKLSQTLPHAELYTFEKGFGHLAPAIKSEEFYCKVNEFIAGL
jgi:pimeloyl-ACP methyl ester carboxylesterase